MILQEVWAWRFRRTKSVHLSVGEDRAARGPVGRDGEIIFGNFAPATDPFCVYRRLY
jgi:hypothetical protein